MGIIVQPLERPARHSRWSLRQALAYLESGLSILPVARDGSKAPDVQRLPRALGEDERYHPTWDPFKEALPKREDLEKWFANGTPSGIGIIGGAVSGYLETLDFDTEAETIFPDWCELVKAEAPGLIERLSVARTPKPGFHVRYRCPGLGAIPGNMKLASDPAKPRKEQTLIETRGEGGYAVAPGSPLECHVNRTPYTHHSGPPLEAVETITPEEREILIRSAYSFDRSAPPEPNRTRQSEGLTPGDDFDARGPDWPALLEPHGWQAFRQRGAVTYWPRPGKEEPGWSATTGACTSKNGKPLFVVFSSNASPFPGPEGGRNCSTHSKFSTYTLLNHAGDFSASAKALAQQGYGSKQQRTSTNTGQANPGEQQSTPKPTSAPEVWDPPIPLGEHVALPPFPVECLPRWLAEWCSAEAEATQTPVDLAASLCLATAGAALARKLRVTIRDPWSEPVNLFTVTALPPGERKSAVFADVLAPAVEWERQEQERMAPIIAQLASEHRILEERLKMAEKAVAKAEDADERKRLLEEAKTLAAEVDAHKVPDEPQVFCDDVTPEKLGQLIARQGGRMLLDSAEGTVFEIAKGRYTESPNFDVFLKGHAGDPLRVGRVGRDSESVDRPALSCALAVQPDVIHGLADEATMRGRGFLARWLYSLPTSHVGKRRIAAPAVPEAVAQRFAAGMLSLWQFKEDRDIKGRPTAFEICLSRGADNLMREFEEWLEPQLAEGEELSFLAGWANKLPGAIARLAGILHMAETLPGPSWGLPINEGTITAAIQIGRDYYLPHARAAFGLMGGNPNVKNARRVVRWLVDSLNSLKTLNGVPVFEVTRSKIHSDVLGGRIEVKEVDQIIKVLLDHDYLRPLTTETRLGPGRRPSPRYQVNPYIALSQKRAPRSDNSDNSGNGEGRHHA